MLARILERAERLRPERIGAPVPEPPALVGDVVERRRVAIEERRRLAPRLPEVLPVREPERRLVAGRARDAAGRREALVEEEVLPQVRRARIVGEAVGGVGRRGGQRRELEERADLFRREALDGERRTDPDVESELDALRLPARHHVDEELPRALHVQQHAAHEVAAGRRLDHLRPAAHAVHVLRHPGARLDLRAGERLLRLLARSAPFVQPHFEVEEFVHRHGRRERAPGRGERSFRTRRGHERDFGDRLRLRRGDFRDGLLLRPARDDRAFAGGARQTQDQPRDAHPFSPVRRREIITPSDSSCERELLRTTAEIFRGPPPDRSASPGSVVGASVVRDGR